MAKAYSSDLCIDSDNNTSEVVTDYEVEGVEREFIVKFVGWYNDVRLR